MTGSISTGFGTTISDNFDSHTIGAKAHGGSLWIPDTDPALRWVTWIGTHTTADPSRHMSIEAGSAYGGRSGNVLKVNNGIQKGVTYAYLNEPGITEANNDQWQLSIDFYIDQLVTTESSTSTMMLLGAFSADFGAQYTNVANRLFSFAVRKTHSTGAIDGLMNVGETAVGGNEDITISGLAEDTWYTLTVNGNNQNQTVQFTLTDGTSTQESQTYYYRQDLHTITRFTVGDLVPGQGDLVMDNFSLTQIPEPTTAMLMLGTGVVISTVLSRKKAQ